MSTIIVTTTADIVDANDGVVSLREAIADANANAGEDIITFDASLSGSMIRLSATLSSTDELIIDGDIDGDHTADITISGDAAGDDTMAAGHTDLAATLYNNKFNDNVQILSSSAGLRIEGVILTGGKSDTSGGAISQTGSGSLNVDYSSFYGNAAFGGNGGAISAETGNVTINDSVLNSNLGTNGGAVSTDSGSITVYGSSLTSNTAQENGGAIYSDSGAVEITSSNINDNSANTDGGAAYGGSGDVVVHASTMQNNFAGNNGGAVAASGSITVSDSELTSNSAVSAGGAVYGGSEISITRTHVQDNTALLGGGIAAFGSSVITITGSTFLENNASSGGAVYGQSGEISVTDSALVGNTAGSSGGGIAATQATVTVVNSTIAGNTAAGDAGGVLASTLVLKNATVTGNTAVVGIDGLASDTLTATNSIVLGNGETDISTDSSTVTFLGGNIAGVFDAVVTGSYMTAAVADVFAAVDGVTGGGSVTDNGGSVLTVALKASASNLALDAADGTGTATDARGVATNDYGGIYNSNGSGRDLGAYELTATGGAKALDGSATMTINEDQQYDVSDLLTIATLDDGSATVTVRFAAGSGEFTFGSTVAVPPGITWGWSNGQTFTGTVAALNAYFASGDVRFQESSGTASPLAVTIELIESGSVTVSKTVTVNVTAMNDAPTIDTGNEFGVTEDVAGSLTDLVFIDNDAGDNPVTATLAVTAGTLAATGTAAVTVGGTATALTLKGTLADVNAFIAGGAVTYLTAANANGSVPLTVTIDDNGSTGGGGPKSAQFSLSISIGGVNDAPTGTPSATLPHGTEDVAYIVSSAALLQGLTDVEGDTLSVSGLTASNGTVNDNGNGTYTITQAANFNGNVTLSYSAIDGHGGTLSGLTRTYTVDAVNSAPTAIALSAQTISENAAAGTIVGSLSATDAESTAGFTYQLIDSAGGRFAIDGDKITVATGVLLDFEQATSHNVTVRVTDEGGATFDKVFAIGVLDVNPETIVGDASANVLMGGAGGDTIDGGAGDDEMSGGAGDDTYTVDSLDDVVQEGVDQGTDTVTSSTMELDLFDWANVENITLTGTLDLIAFGNEFANTLRGNSGNNYLEGGDGIDTLIGGEGDDSYYVESADDIVTELADEGTDELRTSNFNLDLSRYANIENGRLYDGLNLNLTGNIGANVLTGNDGKNVITGGLGRDTMTGGLGKDVFDFNKTAESGKTAALRDVITDFKSRVDKIDLSTIDASSKMKGDQSFYFSGTSKFHKFASELRYFQINAAGTANDKTIVEGDVNGDGKADFQIELTGLKTLSAADFVL